MCDCLSFMHSFVHCVLLGQRVHFTTVVGKGLAKATKKLD